MAILLNQRILPIGWVSSGRVCACSVHSRLVLYNLPLKNHKLLKLVSCQSTLKDHIEYRSYIWYVLVPLLYIVTQLIVHFGKLKGYKVIIKINTYLDFNTWKALKICSIISSSVLLCGSFNSHKMVSQEVFQAIYAMDLRECQHSVNSVNTWWPCFSPSSVYKSQCLVGLFVCGLSPQCNS